LFNGTFEFDTTTAPLDVFRQRIIIRIQKDLEDITDFVNVTYNCGENSAEVQMANDDFESIYCLDLLQSSGNLAQSCTAVVVGYAPQDIFVNTIDVYATYYFFDQQTLSRSSESTPESATIFTNTCPDLRAIVDLDVNNGNYPLPVSRPAGKEVDTISNLEFAFFNADDTGLNGYDVFKAGQFGYSMYVDRNSELTDSTGVYASLNPDLAASGSKFSLCFSTNPPRFGQFLGEDWGNFTYASPIFCDLATFPNADGTSNTEQAGALLTNNLEIGTTNFYVTSFIDAVNGGSGHSMCVAFGHECSPASTLSSGVVLAAAVLAAFL